MTIELTGDNANVILDDGLIFNTDEGAPRGSNAPPPVTGNTFGLIRRRSTTRHPPTGLVARQTARRLRDRPQIVRHPFRDPTNHERLPSDHQRARVAG